MELEKQDPEESSGG